jgi:ubiquinone/menaquinone biosynthesis C-methylase UbiE
MTEYFDEFPYDTVKEIDENPDSADVHIYMTKVETVFSMLGMKRGGRILDIGCGTGYTSLRYPGFRNNNNEITSMDLSEKEIYLAKKYAINSGENQNFIIANALYLPFKNESFDAAFCIGVLHHIPDHQKALEEMTRVSKKICCVEPNNINPLQIIYQRTRLAKMRGDVKAFYLSGLKKDFISVKMRHVKTRRILFTVPFFNGILLKMNLIIEPILEKIPLINCISGSIVIYGEK